MEPQIQYATTSDGVSIAYCVEGEGAPLIALPAFIESFSLLHLFPEEDAFWLRVTERHRLIRLDWRGTGLSQREIEHSSLDANCRDIDAVVKALELDRFAVWASGTGAPMGLRFAGTRANVSRLVAYGAHLKSVDSFSEEAIRAYAMLWRTNPGVAAQSLADLTHRSHPTAGQQLGRIFFESINPQTAAQLFEDSLDLDWNAEKNLPGISAPTLVMHRRQDALFPFAIGQKIAAGIRSARFLPLEGEIHYHALGDSEAVLNAMFAFLAEDAPKPAPKASAPPDSAVRAVLFTDLVGHTEMMSRLGDERGRDVLREHERITREVLKANGGTEVKTMGDGFMASFGSVTKAVECAIALQRAFAEREGEALNVRVGLNAGEPIEEDGDLFGATVILASRIAAKAEGGEILVADTVRGLCSGKGFLFADRGDFVAKGIEEPVRISEVNWRSQ